MIGEAVPLDPTEHLLHLSMLPIQGVVAALPNTEKQTQGGCQNEETKKYGPNKRTKQNSKKELNKIEISNLSHAVRNTVTRMLKELSEDLNTKKKIQSKTKDTLIEIKNTLQCNNSRAKEAENQINDFYHKEAKNNQSD